MTANWSQYNRLVIVSTDVIVAEVEHRKIAQGPPVDHLSPALLPQVKNKNGGFPTSVSGLQLSQEAWDPRTANAPKISPPRAKHWT